MHSIIPKVYRADEDVTLILIFEFFNYSWFTRITNNYSENELTIDLLLHIFFRQSKDIKYN